AERFIGSIRRECLNHVVVLGERHLRWTLKRYIRYYLDSRTHLSLKKGSPDSRSVQSVGEIMAIPHVGGLHHRYERRVAEQNVESVEAMASQHRCRKPKQEFRRRKSITLSGRRQRPIVRISHSRV